MNYQKIILFLFFITAHFFIFSVLVQEETYAQGIINTQSQTTGGSYQNNPLENNTGISTNLKASTFQELVTNFIVQIGNMTIRLFVALSLLVFLWGLAKYMFKGQGSDTARVEGRKLMLWGIIGLFVMTSVWGLVSILSSILGHTDVGVPQFRR